MSATLIVNEQVLVNPTLSFAVQTTVVEPREKAYGVSGETAGTQPTLAMPLPSVAVTVGMYDTNERVGVNPFVGEPW